ncbi:MAG: hypothetical protein H8D22_04235 [Candidatus Cloacimonetes bacterium]|nr:hypothetical protein [Candidatus Cloacimonadota bacterium]
MKRGEMREERSAFAVLRRDRGEKSEERKVRKEERSAFIAFQSPLRYAQTGETTLKINEIE